MSNPTLSPTLSLSLIFLTLISSINASITVYSVLGPNNPSATTTLSGSAASYTGAAAYNPTTLLAPTPPGPTALPTSFVVEVERDVPQGASIRQRGSFFGFSVEMSVVNQVLGKNSSFLQVPFLNLMANLQARSGRVDIRVGGNTQETAVLVDSTPDGKILEKDVNGVSNPTQTPPLIFTPELIKMLRSISGLVNVRWHLGIPLNDTSNLRMQIAEVGQQILGDYLIGLQVGNEPDLYVSHGHRADTYGPEDYFGEFGVVVNATNADTLIPMKNLLIGPNLSGNWTPEMVWDTGFIDAYSSSLGALAVEHYPNNNCFAQFGVGTYQDPQSIFPSYLTHTAGQALAAPYLASADLAQTKGKELLMFETNTASCGGFPGISDSFGAALWGLDYGMQLAYSNFSGALFHVGGQNVFYNPFTPPPTNQSTFHQWTVGPLYYSALVMHETLGASNTSRVVDLKVNDGNEFTPGYAVYEEERLARVLLVNFVSDASGESDVVAAISVPITTASTSDGTTSSSSSPAPVPPPQTTQVWVKYLGAASVSQKGNIMWGNQTFGDIFESDGRPVGVESVETVQCTVSTSGAGDSTNDGNNDGNTNMVCNIKVKAPGAALVFFGDSTTGGSGGNGAGVGGGGGGGMVQGVTTFATTALTQVHNTVYINSTSVGMSNGHWWAASGGGNDGELGSTSEGSVQDSGVGGRVRGVGRVYVMSTVVVGLILIAVMMG